MIGFPNAEARGDKYVVVYTLHPYLQPPYKVTVCDDFSNPLLFDTPQEAQAHADHHQCFVVHILQTTETTVSSLPFQAENER